MKEHINTILLLLLLFQLFILVSNKSSAYLDISRSRRHEDQTGKLTPLVVSMSTEDKKEKVKGVDLIFIVDISGSMRGDRINLVKQSLKYIANLMNEQDNMALIKFDSSATKVNGFLQMNESNKKTIINNINSLIDWGGTNIYSGLKLGLEQITKDYSNGDRVCSMVLLSDGQDGRGNADLNFVNLLSSSGKKNYIFTLHTIGYGTSHDAVLMEKIASIRDGGYFFIEKYSKVEEVFLQIYGSLSTVYQVNVNLLIQSNFKIHDVYGRDEMYNASLSNANPYTFNVNIIHFQYGKTYSYVALVEVPENTPYGTEVLRAKASILNKIAYFYWDQNYMSNEDDDSCLFYDSLGYEAYIRGITSTIFTNAYNSGQTKGKTIINNGLIWIEKNYKGVFDWKSEYEDALNDFIYFSSSGKANILSKIRQLKSQSIGNHFDFENSFITSLVDGSHDIKVDDKVPKNITEEETIKTETNKNYYYFYLKDGVSKINGTHFSGEHSSLIIYTENSEEINIKTLSGYFEYYTWSEKKTRIQNIIDIGRGGNFIIKKDFPFDFYTYVDGKNDIIFNIQFLNFEYKEMSSEPQHLFEIKAFIINTNQINTLSRQNANTLPGGTMYKGYYDKGFRIGKILFKKEDILKYARSSSQDDYYLYIVVQKASNSNVVYTKVEGQFSFIKMNYIYNYVPESFYVFNDLSVGQKTPHIYSLKMEKGLGKDIKIEFATSGNELDCKVLKYNNYPQGSEEVYTDYELFDVQRETYMGKTYIYVTQSNDPNSKFDDVILSIFSKNQGHIAGSESTQLAYTIRYTTYSNYGIYNFNDIKEKNGKIDFIQNFSDNRDIKINFYPLQYQKIGQKYNRENTRFFLKVYPLIKSRQNIYDSISLFEKDVPLIYKEIYSKNENELSLDFQVSLKANYFFTVHTISKETNEILAYTNRKIYRYPKDIIINDNNSFENEYNEALIFDFKVANDIKKKNLIIQMFDFDDIEYEIKATIDGQVFQFDPFINVIKIPNEKCSGKTVKLEVKLNVKEGEYYLSIGMSNESYEYIEAQVNSLSYTVQYTLHPDSEYAKVCTLKNGDVLALTSVVNTQQTKIGKLNNEGRPRYGNATLNIGYSPDAQLVQPVNSDFYYFSHHNKQNLAGQEAKEKTITFKDKNTIIEEMDRKNSLYQKTSTIALKNGQVFIAGINPVSGFGAETMVDLNIYEPKSGKSGKGLSFKSTSKYISCYEQKEGNVYCVYVSYETFYVSKLKIKHILVNGNILTNKGEEEIKTFYTEFNFLKAIPFNREEALVLLQVGNGKKPPNYGNTGKDLYFYHLQVVDSPEFVVTIKRYEYLYDKCFYDINEHNPEDYNADIAVLSQNTIYAVCETQLNKFKGFIIYPSKKEIDEFYFNNFNAENVKNPVYAKFGKSMGIFYTYINENYNSKVAYHLINFPDCYDFRNYPILLPKGFAKELDFSGKVFLSNPYPSNRKEILKVRFKSYSNIIITNTMNNNRIVPDSDYDSLFTLRFVPKGIEGQYDIKYTATRQDPFDGLIIGKTCKVTFNTPECLEQCESCTEIGTEEHHNCLGCKVDGPYYEEEDPTAINEGYGKPHLCKRCNISCSSCWGPFIERPKKTTNCKKCDYNNNYFHYEFDERTCISNETKEYWQDIYGFAFYLDTSAGPEKKEEWRWRHCHQNCAECFEKGDDNDNKCNKCKKNYYFFCNQTVGHGIPGSCHTGCKNNGFYIKIDEDREKCCPCINHCKECKDNIKCDKCYPPFFKTENDTLCNESCGYCLAEDRNLWECVNCKTRFKTPRYTLNKTCVSEIPFIESIKRYHHIIDDKCNLLHGCKEGCYKCNPWYSDNCTECNSSYYKEDFYSIEPQPLTFHCFNKTTCQGVTPYIHNEKLRIGGVPILENQENVCLNCKLRNNSYRLPENKFYCGEKINRTYVDIEDYNKLSYCYFRCKECDFWGNAMIMNCSTCRDGANYKPLIKIGNYYNCYKKQHKCGIFPYYHDYDLAEELGIDEDNCGENCDVCLYNFTCTETFPYYVYETHECVEYCPLSDILGHQCLINNTRGGILLLENPFGLRHPHDFLNSSVTLNELISTQFFQYISKAYNIDINTLKNEINNNLGKGQIYNLPESQIIIGNNISIEISSVKLELEKLSKLLKGEGNINKNVSIIDLSNCQNVLRNKYGLSSEEDLMIIKGDLLQQLSEQYLSNQVEYQLFSTSMGAFLPLKDCKDTCSSVTVTNPFNSSLLLGQLQFKAKSVVEEGYNVFDAKSSFYNDICTPFTNENGNDVLLDERRADYFDENYNLCEKGCKFIGFNESINMYSCNCSIKTAINEQSDYEVTPMEIPEDFYKKPSQYSNIKVFKCASQVFSLKGQKKNLGSYILFGCFFSFVISIIVYCILGNKQMDSLFSELSNISKNNPIPSNPPKPSDPPKSSNEIIMAPKKSPEKIEIDFVLKDEDLNLADYKTAINNDKRSFIKYYWSLLKMKQLLIFTFYTHTDHNLRIVKIALFILFLSFYFAFTALFFNDYIMREIYTYKGNTDAAIHVTNILLSSACCLIMNFIIRLISLSERDKQKVIQDNNPDNRKALSEKVKKCLKVKLAILFTISGLLIALCWYYVSAFCAVFKNSQIHYFFNVLAAFILCNIWPFITSLFAPCFRIPSLKKDNLGCIYKFSQIIAYF